MIQLARMRRILRLGLLAIWRHRLRSALTMLGIVFGVCSVIAMLAVGEGASYEAQQRIKQLGSTNIIVRSVKPPQTESVNNKKTWMIEYGLTYADVDRFAELVPDVVNVVPSRSIRCEISFRRTRADADCVGTTPLYPQIANQHVARGRFISDQDMILGKNVAVLSAPLRDKLFQHQDPLGQTLRVQGEYYRVVGVMAPSGTAVANQAEGALPGRGSPAANLRSAGMVLYIPLTAARNRFGEILAERTSGSRSYEKVELHQILVKVRETTGVLHAAEIVQALLKKFHKQSDYEVIVPLELLRETQRTKRIFNIVLGSIAAISLLVGGIGIMNIMLASVTERTREIGIRRALGARREDIVIQFLTETVLLSSCGGIAGVVLGIVMPSIIGHFAGMTTIIQPLALVGAFGISVLIGIIFGMYPAWRAAKMNPIEALRHE